MPKAHIGGDKEQGSGRLGRAAKNGKTIYTNGVEKRRRNTAGGIEKIGGRMAGSFNSCEPGGNSV